MGDFPFDDLEPIAARVEAGKASIDDYRQMFEATQRIMARQNEFIDRQNVIIEKLEARVVAELEVSTNLSILLLSGQRGFDVGARC